MIAIFTVLHVIISLLLILIVLIQSGKGAMMGASLGAGQQLFGGSGGKTFFTRATGVLIGLFMANCLWIAYLQSSYKPVSDLKRKLTENAPVPQPPASGSVIPIFGTPGSPAAAGSPNGVADLPFSISTPVVIVVPTAPPANVPPPKGAPKPPKP